MNTIEKVLQTLYFGGLDNIPDIEIVFDNEIGKSKNILRKQLFDVTARTKIFSDAGYAERLLFAGESLYV